MLANIGYTTVVLQTSAAFLQIAAPMTFDRATLAAQNGEIASSHTWSDRVYRFNFISVPSNAIVIDEKQSRTLHNALIASFHEFIVPFELS